MECRPARAGGARPDDRRVARNMPNLTQAELLQDLERQQGTVFQRTMLHLLSRGRSGIRQVAARLGGEMDARLDAALKGVGRQVIEMVVRAGTLDEECGVALLLRVEPGDLVEKASELWERGDREEAMSIVRRLGPSGAGTGTLRLMHARIALAGGSPADALALYRGAAEAGISARGIMEGASLALECGRLEEAAAVLSYAPRDGTSQFDAPAGEVLYRALRHEDGQALQACCGRLSRLGPAFLASSILAAVAIARKSDTDTIRDMQQQIDDLAGALSKAEMSAYDLLSEIPPISDVAARVDGALREFEEIAVRLGRALEAGLPERHESTGLSPLVGAVLASPAQAGSVAAALSAISAEDLAQSCADGLRDALDLETTSVLKGPWARTAEALTESLATGRGLRDLLTRVEGTPRAAVFERVSLDVSFMNAYMDDASLRCVMSQGGQERYELLTGALEDSLRAPQGLAKEKQAGLSADIQRDLPRLRIVRPWVARALQNLVALAVRQARPGGVVSLSARVPVPGAWVEISLKGDVIRVPSGLRTLDQVLARHHWRMDQPRQAGPTTQIVILAPESSEEDALRAEIADYDELLAGTKQALRAAEALGGSAESAAAAAFLYGKALEIEIPAALLPDLERHVLLPRALTFKSDSQAFSDAARAAAVAVGGVEREVMKRADQMVDAVVRNRVRKETGDWRSLAVALAMFGTVGSGHGTDEFLKALYRAEQVRDASRADISVVETARSLCRAVLSGLSGIKAERMGRRPPPTG